MKILHLTTHINSGGISKYILMVGSSFIHKGNQVYVASSGGDMEPQFLSEGICVKKIDIRTKSELNFKIYRNIPELIRWIHQEGIDLIHAHTRVTQVMANWIQHLTKIPFITTAHGFYKHRLGRRILPAWGDRVVAISEAVGADLRDHHQIDPKKIRVVYNGVNLDELMSRFLSYDPGTTRKEFGFSEDAYVIGIVARLVSDKGHEYLIRSIKKLETEIPNLRLLIVGDGRYRPKLIELTRKLNLMSRIYFTGNLKDVAKPLAAMHLFVLPATWREGFGLSIVEAMTCKKPVIVTNIWALNTLIEDRVNGILVEPRDPIHLANAIRTLVKDPILSAKIGAAGQETARKRFSLNRMALELEAVYEEVLSR